MKLSQTIVVLSLLVGPPLPPAFALNESSHEIVNEQAAVKSILDQVLKEQLGLSGGLKEPIKGKVVLQWFRDGGRGEDEGTLWKMLRGKARFFRHFHDPLQPWDSSGLKFLFFPRFESAVRWAQRTDQSRETGHGNYSWLDARRYYQTALTGESPAVREQAFADTFRALGQTMHLVVDASVPEHVRNDEHPLGPVFGNYEYWVSAQHPDRDSEQAFVQGFLSTPIALDPELLKIPITASETIARVPIARLFDSDRYTGTNPEVTVEARIGIAETANANFFSEDTRHGDYPHPARANLERYVRLYTKTGRPRAYFRKRGAGLTVDPVAEECALYEPAGLDELCVDTDVWRETAWHMLPRAVSYSTALLDYFFRGELDVKREADSETGLPSLAIVNRSPEPLGEGGTLTLYQDNDQRLRSPVLGASLELTAAVPKDNDEAPRRLPLPVDLPEAGLTLVYEGPLGLEPKAVIGKALPEIAVEQVYRDWMTNEWILRTKDDLYVLPLETVAELTVPLERVIWGDRDNQLVGVTAPDGPDPYQALLFELDRPLRSAQVPVADSPSTELPPANLRLVQRVPLDEVLGAVKLNTAVEFAGRLEFAQYLPTYVVTITCVDTDPKPEQDAYECTRTTGQDAVDPTPVKTWSDTVRASFPFQLTPEHHAPRHWDAPHYRWALAEVRADRASHLVAVVKVEPGCLPPEETIREVVLREVDRSGALVDGAERAYFDQDFFCPPFQVLVTVDLTAGRLLAKSSEDQITIQQTQRVVVPTDDVRFPVGVRYDLTYAGGTQNGKRDRWWEVRRGGDPVPWDTPTRVGLKLTEHGETRVDAREGLFRPSLATLGLGEVNPAINAADVSELWYRSDLDGTAVLLQVPFAGSVPEIEWSTWMRWTGPAPGRLRFEAHTWIPQDDVVRTRFVSWNLGTEQATLAHTATTEDTFDRITGNASGVLVTSRSEDYSLWIPWTGGFLPFPDLDYWTARDYLALDPDYLYNVETGHFHTLRPGLPEEARPAPLAFGEEDEGEYHVVGR